MNRRFNWESFIIVAIILVIIQTFFSEVSIYYHWRRAIKSALLFAGLFFDLTFTIEFIVRSVNWGRRGKFVQYIFHNRGWVDFFSSVPLLLLHSGPLVMLFFSSGRGEAVLAIGILNVLKVVKAIRVTRILRLIRVMKIFGKIRNAESKMAQHHTATIATTAVSIVLCVIFIFTFTVGDPVENVVNERREYYEGLTQRLLTIGIPDDESRRGLVKQVFISDQNLLKLFYRDSELFSSINDEAWKAQYSLDDYIEVRNSDYRILISIVDIQKKSAMNSLLLFSIILTLVVGFMFLYTRHFVQTISDIIFILLKGFGKKGYSLLIRIPEEYADHEIFQLARFYNETFLPAKMKRLYNEKLMKRSSLSIDDLKKFDHP